MQLLSGMLWDLTGCGRVGLVLLVHHERGRRLGMASIVSSLERTCVQSLFLQLHLSGMCCSLDMFWHVYFSSRTCQACTAFDSVFTFVLPGRTDATLKQFERHKLEKKKRAAHDPLSDFIVNCW